MDLKHTFLIFLTAQVNNFIIGFTVSLVHLYGPAFGPEIELTLPILSTIVFAFIIAGKPMSKTSGSLQMRGDILTVQFYLVITIH